MPAAGALRVSPAAAVLTVHISCINISVIPAVVLLGHPLQW
jgi:hypothetical protein